MSAAAKMIFLHDKVDFTSIIIIVETKLQLAAKSVK